MIIEFQPPSVGKVTNHQTRLPRATSSLALNASRDGASTTPLGNLFHCVTTLCVKNFLLISNLKLSCHSLKLFPLVLSLSTRVNQLLGLYECSGGWHKRVRWSQLENSQQETRKKSKNFEDAYSLFSEQWPSHPFTILWLNHFHVLFSEACHLRVSYSLW